MAEFAEAARQILVNLMDGEDWHGYAIMKESESDQSAHHMTQGTLYRNLRLLLEKGLIEEGETPANETDYRRRYYHITLAGRQAIIAEGLRLEKIAQQIRIKSVIDIGQGSDVLQ